MIFNSSNAALIRSENYSLHDGTIDSFRYDPTELSIEMIVSTTTDTAKLQFDKVHYCLINHSFILTTDCRNELNGWGSVDRDSISDLSICKLISDDPLAVEFEFVNGSKILIVCDTIHFERV